MDNLLIALGCLIICSVPVHASELLGKISTDPNANLTAEAVSLSDYSTGQVSSAQASSTNNKTETKIIKVVPTSTQPVKKVLGQKIAVTMPKKHQPGELIRQIGDVKVYALKPSQKHHVLNLKELARDYFGLTIYNLKPEEMQGY